MSDFSMNNVENRDKYLSENTRDELNENNLSDSTNTFFVIYDMDGSKYSRDYMLDRASELFAKKNKKTMPNLDSERLNRKTYIKNITAIAEKLNRKPEDLKAFFSSELRITASFKEDSSLKLDQIFDQKTLNTVYINYLKSIQCTGCKSIDTLEKKENRITFLECNDCRRRGSK